MRGDAASGGGSPYFFLSYAHTPRNDAGDTDPNIWVKKLYDGLCAHIMQMTDLPRGARAGFLDQGMAVGTRWTDELSENLARCKVFVPLYSPRYFISEQCGREWWAFSQRQISHRARGGAAREHAIIPALWVPVEPVQLPHAAKDLQFNHVSFGQDYAEEGFYGLTKLRYLRDEYERALYRLAKQIVHVARVTELDEGRMYDEYESLPSAFGTSGHPPEFDITVLACTRSDLPPGRGPDCYGTLPRDWNPYHPASARPLGEHAADLVRTMDYKVNIGDFEKDADRLLGPGPPRAPGLLLLDRWALGSARGRELLERLCEEQRPWISVMIPRCEDDAGPAREKRLTALTERALAARMTEGSGHRTLNGGIRTLDAFGNELQTAVKQAVASYEAHARTYPPAGPRIEPPRLRGPADLGG
ncbi:TIR-like protein FxsC [Streptomyces sp. NPDC057438]|uniref:TIR-like protein FxsC n=1 Tax=Streptomyces sp. NPDC057438 TaxID=3346133 RepID=UPI0036B5F1AD